MDVNKLLNFALTEVHLNYEKMLETLKLFDDKALLERSIYLSIREDHLDMCRRFLDAIDQGEEAYMVNGEEFNITRTGIKRL